MRLSEAGEKQRFFVGLQQSGERVLQLLFPPRCAACGEVLPAEQVFEMKWNVRADVHREAASELSRIAAFNQRHGRPNFETWSGETGAEIKSKEIKNHELEKNGRKSEAMRLLCPGCIHAFRFMTGAVCAKCGREITDWDEGKTAKKLPERGMPPVHVSAQSKMRTGTLPVREADRYRGAASHLADARLLGESSRAGAGDSCHTPSRQLCRDCTKKLRLFEHCFCVMHYEGVARRAMSDIKYRHQKEYLRFFAAAASERFGEELCALSIDAMTPVPVHPKRRRERGYNQAEVLCRELSQRLDGMPVVTDLLRRRKKTNPQKELSADDRMRNLHNAFEPYHVYEGIHTVLLVDDIYTTGATLEACTEALLKTGVERVYGLCICGGSC